jgi:hypothetical protein
VGCPDSNPEASPRSTDTDISKKRCSVSFGFVASTRLFLEEVLAYARGNLLVATVVQPSELVRI